MGFGDHPWPVVDPVRHEQHPSIAIESWARTRGSSEHDISGVMQMPVDPAEIRIVERPRFLEHDGNLREAFGDLPDKIYAVTLDRVDDERDSSRRFDLRHCDFDHAGHHRAGQAQSLDITGEAAGVRHDPVRWLDVAAEMVQAAGLPDVENRREAVFRTGASHLLPRQANQVVADNNVGFERLDDLLESVLRYGCQDPPQAFDRLSSCPSAGQPFHPTHNATARPAVESHGQIGELLVEPPPARRR